jgi:putative addiction module killer protein
MALMNTIVQSETFSKWLHDLSDEVARGLILRRLISAELGNFGDCEPVGEGISEMRVHHGPGYRVYFVRRGTTVYLLLCGGNKASQKSDIRLAKKMLKDMKELDA